MNTLFDRITDIEHEIQNLKTTHEYGLGAFEFYYTEAELAIANMQTWYYIDLSVGSDFAGDIPITIVAPKSIYFTTGTEYSTNKIRALVRGRPDQPPLVPKLQVGIISSIPLKIIGTGKLD